jgi:hypothetical protein
MMLMLAEDQHWLIHRLENLKRHTGWRYFTHNVSDPLYSLGQKWPLFPQPVRRSILLGAHLSARFILEEFDSAVDSWLWPWPNHFSGSSSLKVTSFEAALTFPRWLFWLRFTTMKPLMWLFYLFMVHLTTL